MRLVAWVARATLFFLLFALALNNLHDVDVRGLFGTEWRAPMIVVILVSFASGTVLALVAMWPRTWRRRPTSPDGTPAASPSTPPAPSAADEAPAQLRRDGL